jgi:signal transduction histidine kinase
MLINEQTGELEHFVSRHLEASTCTTALLHWSGTREVIHTKAPVVVQNHRLDRREDQLFVRTGWVSHLGLPLLTRGEALGVLAIFTDEEHTFTDAEIAFFTTLAGQAVIALQNARLFTEVRNGHQQLKELSHRLLEVQETDRRHIARELHDEVGQILTGLQITLEMTGHSSDKQANMTLANAQALVNDLIRHVRRLSLDLRPSLLDDLGLLPTFLWYLERYSSTTGVHVHFHHDGLEGKRFLPQVEPRHIALSKKP